MIVPIDVDFLKRFKEIIQNHDDRFVIVCGGGKTARDYILSRVTPQKISALEIIVETAGLKPVTVSIDVELALSPLMEKYNAGKLADEATKRAFEAIEQYFRELSCKSKT